MQNRKLATYLKIAQKQRERQRENFASQFGSDSGAVVEVDKELTEIKSLISDLERYPDDGVHSAQVAERIMKEFAPPTPPAAEPQNKK